MKAVLVEKNTCKGLRFRAYSGFYKTAHGFEEKRGFRLLKRQSCLGCKFCGSHLFEFIQEVLMNYDSLPIEGNKEIDTFKDYSVNIMRCDGEDIEFYPLKDRIYK